MSGSSNPNSFFSSFPPRSISNDSTCPSPASSSPLFATSSSLFGSTSGSSSMFSSSSSLSPSSASGLFSFGATPSTLNATTSSTTPGFSHSFFEAGFPRKVVRSGRRASSTGLSAWSSPSPAPNLPKLPSPPNNGAGSPPPVANPQVISLKIMVEKKNNRVVFAECDKDFIDLIFSFLTLPTGTILRLLGEKSPPPIIGCMNNLYESVGKLETRFFKTEACKEMLLSPIRSSETQCRSLTLKTDDLKCVKCFYFCQNPNCGREGIGLLSDYPSVRCRCGQVMNGLAALSEPAGGSSCDEEVGVFVRGAEMFLVSDDLQVTVGSTSTSIFLLKKLCIVDANELESRSSDFGPEEILQLLRLSLVSSAPLTCLVMSEQSGSDVTRLEPKKTPLSLDKSSATNETKKMTLKLFFSKSQNKAVHAESEQDFVDLLFTFLAFPLGSVLKLLGGKSFLGCVDNIYQSVNDLSNDNYLKCEELKDTLLSPKLAPYFACENRLLHIEESCHPQYVLDSYGDSNDEWCVCPAIPEGVESTSGQRQKKVSFVNPKSSGGETSSGGGFVKGLTKFMITDDLVVTPLTPISSISSIGKLNVSITDIVDAVVMVGEQEALNLLRAALISKTALTDVFSQKYRSAQNLVPVFD